GKGRVRSARRTGFRRRVVRHTLLIVRAASFAVAFLLLASLAPNAHAQGAAPIEKCTGNFEEAQLKEKRGKLVEAEQLYGACADAICPAMLRNDCTAERAEIAQRIPTATIVIRDASGNDVDAKVEIDGKPLTDRAHAQPIDPGEHSVTYTVVGRGPATQ